MTRQWTTVWTCGLVLFVGCTVNPVPPPEPPPAPPVVSACGAFKPDCSLGGSIVVDLQVAPFDGDDLPDVAVALAGPDQIEVYTNLDDGVFAVDAITTFRVAELPNIDKADMDLDGDLDLLVSHGGDGELAVWLNDGAGRFIKSEPLFLTIPVLFVETADIDGDGDPDGVGFSGNAVVTILSNDGSGNIDLHSSFGLSIGSTPIAAEFVDADRDGDADVLVTLVPSIVPGVEQDESGTLVVLLNDGNGGFTVGQTTVVGGDAGSVAPADLDGDGIDDVVVGRGITVAANSFVILSGRGDGTYGPPVEVSAGGGPFVAYPIDLDGDGDIDIATANADDGTLSILINDGSGGLQLRDTVDVGPNVAALEPADLDGDGDPDMVAVRLPLAGSTQEPASFFVLLNDGTGLLAIP